MARPASTDFDREIRSQVAANLNNLLRKRGWTKSDLSKETEISPLLYPGTLMKNTISLLAICKR